MTKTNYLYYGDNLEILAKHVRDETVDLCYIDPPFNSKRTYNQIYNNLGKEDKAQAQAFIDTWVWDEQAIDGFTAITRNAPGVYTKQSIELIIGLSKVLGKGSLLAYLVSMTQRIAQIWRVLKPTGSFYLHCDPTCSHYLKLVLDSLFCPREGEYKNELIWCYRERELSKQHWNKKHDVLLFYTKSSKHTFNWQSVAEPYSEYTLTKKFKHQDEKGHYRLRYKDGRNDPSSESEKTYRQYVDVGVPPRDWLFMPIINQASRERLGYPTQKPEALLERIIKASSNEGDMILDAYCGCGTTIAVAQRLNRRWIGIDITYQAISVILKRLKETFKEEDILNTIDLRGQPKDIEGARALANKKDDRLRKEFEKWAILTYSDNLAIINEKKGADGGIDGVAFIQHNAEDYKNIIFSVKSGHVDVKMGRDLRGVIEREQAAMGIFITLEEPTRPMLQEAKTADVYENPLTAQKFDRLQIVTVQELLAGDRLKVPLTHEVLKRARVQASEHQNYELEI